MSVYRTNECPYTPEPAPPVDYGPPYHFHRKEAWRYVILAQMNAATLFLNAMIYIRSDRGVYLILCCLWGAVAIGHLGGSIRSVRKMHQRRLEAYVSQRRDDHGRTRTCADAE